MKTSTRPHTLRPNAPFARRVTRACFTENEEQCGGPVGGAGRISSRGDVSPARAQHWKLPDLGALLRFWLRPGQKRLFIGMAALTLGAGIGVSTAIFSSSTAFSSARRRFATQIMHGRVTPSSSTPKGSGGISLPDLRGFEHSEPGPLRHLAAVNLDMARPHIHSTANKATQMVNTISARTDS